MINSSNSNLNTIHTSNVLLIEPKEPLEFSTEFKEILNSPKSYGSNDIHELKLELKKINEEFNVALKRLDEIDYDIIDTVDKNDYDSLLNNFKSATQAFEQMSLKLKDMEKDLSQTKEDYIKCKIECENLKTKLDVLKRSSTPRPLWKKCSDLIDSDIWNKISVDKKSDELVNIILNEFLGTYSNLNESETVCDTLPLINPMPRYFLTSLNDLGKEAKSNQLIPIINRRLNRRELCLCIKEIWNAKIKSDYEMRISDQLKKEKMSEFVFSYFRNKFDSVSLGLEWTVNLIESCSRHFRCEEAMFFLGVVYEKLDEEILYHFYSNVGKLYALTKDKVKSDLITLEELRSTLTNFFKLKTQEQIDDLIKSVDSGESEDKKIVHQLLFTEDDEGRLCKFLLHLKNQFYNEKLHYIKLLSDNLSKSSKQINVYEFINSVQNVDPLINENELQRYCDWVYGKNTKHYIISFDQLLMKLNDGHFYMHT